MKRISNKTKEKVGRPAGRPKLNSLFPLSPEPEKSACVAYMLQRIKYIANPTLA